MRLTLWATLKKTGVVHGAQGRALDVIIPVCNRLCSTWGKEGATTPVRGLLRSGVCYWWAHTVHTVHSPSLSLPKKRHVVFLPTLGQPNPPPPPAAFSRPNLTPPALYAQLWPLLWGAVDHVRRAYRCLVDREHELRHGRQQGKQMF